MVFSTATPRRPPVTASRSSVMFVEPMWVYTPTGSSVAVSPLTVTPAAWLSSSPPAVSPLVRMSSMRVSRSLIAAMPNRPLPAVLTPVIGSFGGRGVEADAVAGVALGPDPAQHRAAVPGGGQAVAQRLGDGDVLDADVLRPVELQPDAVAREGGADHGAGAAGVELDGRAGAWARRPTCPGR